MISPRHYNFAAQRGVTLVELLVVIVIIAVVCTFALMNRGSANEQFQRQNVARELKVAFERARFDSVKRRADGTVPQANIVISQTSFTLVTDANMDGDLADANDSVTTDFGGQSIIISNFSGNTVAAITSPITVSFNQRGEPSVAGGGSPTYMVCNTDCSSPGNDDANIVLVTPTGTVNMLGGSETPPTFAAPAVSTVPTSTAIRSETIVN